MRFGALFWQADIHAGRTLCKYKYLGKEGGYINKMRVCMGAHIYNPVLGRLR